MDRGSIYYKNVSTASLLFRLLAKAMACSRDNRSAM